ncbi:MAG TPA: VOC family protein [Thermomicrobiales bacterium]|nr:VOC family protein [Thermomicrobiales bacterium]
MTSIRGIAEIVLNVHDQQAALRFYRDVFGLAVISPPGQPGPIFLQVGPGQAGIPQMIVLAPLPPGAAEFAPPRTLHHLALEVAPEDFDGVREHLQRLGHTLRTGRHPVIPSRTVYVDDPDGNEVELICRAG